MAKKKEVVISDILNVMDEDQLVVCTFSAYGVGYADSWTDGMRTVKECKDRLRYDCLNSIVTGVRYTMTSDKTVPSGIMVQLFGEIIH